MTDLAADPSRDAAFRDRAKAVASYLIDTIQEALNQPSVMQRLAREGSAEAGIDLTWRETGIQEAERIALGLPEKIRFGLLLGPYTEPVAAFALNKLSGARYILLNLLPVDAQRAAQLPPGRRALKQFMANMLHEHRTVIVHEIIHMFDNMRSDVKIREPVYARASGEAYRVLYFNNPEEFNAFFQQIVTEVVYELNALDNRARSAALRSFKGFVRRVDKQPAVQVLRRSYLEKWQRKFDTRLWQTWEYLRQQQLGREVLK